MNEKRALFLWRNYPAKIYFQPYDLQRVCKYISRCTNISSQVIEFCPFQFQIFKTTLGSERFSKLDMPKDFLASTPFTNCLRLGIPLNGRLA